MELTPKILAARKKKNNEIGYREQHSNGTIIETMILIVSRDS